MLYDVAAMLAKVPSRAVHQQVDKLFHFSHVTLWTPRALERTLTGQGLEVEAWGTDGPDLTRYQLGPAVRLGLASLDTAGRITGRRSRLWDAGRGPRRCRRLDDAPPRKVLQIRRPRLRSRRPVRRSG